MKKLFLLLLGTVAGTACFAQTKRIAHFSHGGSAAGFSARGVDNFGLSPKMEEERRKQDSLKVKRDTLSRADTASAPPPVKQKPKSKARPKARVKTK